MSPRVSSCSHPRVSHLTNISCMFHIVKQLLFLIFQHHGRCYKKEGNVIFKLFLLVGDVEQYIATRSYTLGMWKHDVRKCNL